MKKLMIKFFKMLTKQEIHGEVEEQVKPLRLIVINRIHRL
jgi:hypothetical protein